jgi:hypothetical protein
VNSVENVVGFSQEGRALCLRRYILTKLRSLHFINVKAEHRALPV